MPRSHHAPKIGHKKIRSPDLITVGLLTCVFDGGLTTELADQGLRAACEARFPG